MPTRETEFQAGQIVHPKTNPTKRGAIIAVTPSSPENRYTVFLDGKSTTFYASQLEAEHQVVSKLEALDLQQFHAHLTALNILHPSVSTLYSLNAARVSFIPYQFRPVLKFIRSDRPRLLIADGVGVGKTIEAGLILRELQARRDIKSVLIICPKPLVTERKWEQEMRRFDERFTQLDSRALKHCVREMELDGTWPEQHLKTILPYSLFDETVLHGRDGNSGRRIAKGLLDLDPPPRFDLVIVDEAHHIRNTATYVHQGVRFFCEHAEAVVFLTATPVQLGSHDLFVLLNVLRPDLVIDKQTFDHMAEPNPFIHKAIDLIRAQTSGWQEQARELLQSAENTSWGQSILRGDPRFQKVFDAFGEVEFSDERRIECINSLEELHSFSGVISRTRRRDIGDFTVRKPETVSVDFTPSQRRLHDSVLATQARILTLHHGDGNLGFMLSTLRRQTASCLYGLAPMLDDILHRRTGILLEVDGDDDIDPTKLEAAADSLAAQIREVLEQAKHLDPTDPKLEAIRKIIKDKQKLPNNKIMVFSSFRHTLRYLFSHLEADGVRTAMVHGGTPDEERVVSRNRFRMGREHPEALDVLLFSEVGSEGLDYQFCDCMINYDLPWNPMRIEQRIGRIDRNGQKSETVTIYNFITPGTVDAEIYDRCLLRIGVFNGALGASEEILGRITQEIHDVAVNLALTPEERNTKLQQIADNEIRLIQEQQALEEKQAEFFGLRLPTAQPNHDLEDATSFWLSPYSIENLCIQYLKAACGGDADYILGEKALKTLRLSQEARHRLLQDFQQMPRQASIVGREWETWLRGGVPILSITFDPACAVENPIATFVTPVHPMVRQAAIRLDANQQAFSTFNVVDPELPPGRYLFAIYQWQSHGLRDDLRLQPICQFEMPTAQFLEILQRATEAQLDPASVPGKEDFGNLEESHYRLWCAARREHQDWTSQMVGYRRESLKTSHQARMAMLQEQLLLSQDDKIRRMRQAQIANAEADVARRFSELDVAVSKADITTQVVAFGVLQIERPAANVQ